MIENGLENNETLEVNEQEGTGDFPSVFGDSDLVITLPDEEYDKLTENSEEGKNESSNGIKVKREHPKEEEKQQDSDSGSSEADNSE